MSEYREDEEMGPEIIAPLMSTAKVMWLKKLEGEKLKAKLECHKMPSNCKFMSVKPCNKFIWAQAKCHSEDIKLQAIQQALIKSQVCVLRAAEALSNSAKADEKPDYKSVLSTLRDSMALAGHSNQGLNQFRRELFKPSISGSMQRIVKDVPEEEENLFGDNLEKRAKELQESEKALAFLKTKQHSSAGKYHFSKNTARYNGFKSRGASNSHNWHSQDRYSGKKYPQGAAAGSSKNEKPSCKTQRRGNKH